MDNSKPRIVYFFDGFNFYHSLNRRNLRKYLWLDYFKLAEILTPGAFQLSGVVLFTAFANWLPSSRRNHKLYIAALKDRGVEIVTGKFYTKLRECHNCRTHYKSHEEKQTDVNIAVNLLTWAINDKFDEIVIGSADSDLTPAIKALGTEFPQKRITLLFPLGRTSYELRNLGHRVMRTRKRTLASAQFPDTVLLSTGSKVLRPNNWQ